jgi:hypothetical protein
MDTKETHTTLIRSDVLLHNDEYFKYIFKKTEKIVAAVFYTTRSLEQTFEKDTLILRAEERALAVSTASERILAVSAGERIHEFEVFRVALIALESSLTFLTVSRIMREDLLEVFRHEIGSLHRSLREYTNDSHRHPFEETLAVGPRSQGGRRTHEHRGLPREQRVTAQAPRGTEGLLSRRDRILSIIKDKVQVTIKDISGAITDVSEKTIQRELMSLISDGTLRKEGERRWSKYSINAS